MAGTNGKTDFTFTFAEFFAGIGGFRIGLEALGGTCVYANERDEKAAKTYDFWCEMDGRKIVMEVKGLKDVKAKEIPRHDILTAGFPCQPFSLAGVSKKNSRGTPHGFDDPDQGHAFSQMMDRVGALSRSRTKSRPKVLFLENVKHLASHGTPKGDTFEQILARIRKEGYYPYPEIIDACAWVPQHRERMYIVCFDEKVFGRDSSTIGFEWPTPPPGKPRVLKDILLPVSQVELKYELSVKLWNSHQRRKTDNHERNRFLAHYWSRQRELGKEALSTGWTPRELRDRATELHDELRCQTGDYLSAKLLEKSTELLEKWDADFQKALRKTLPGNGSDPIDRETLRAWLREAQHVAPKSRGFQHGLKSRDEQARTLSARYHKDGAEILYKEPTWDRPRRLTPTECGRLMGFDDWYAENLVVKDTHSYRQFGNAVVPPVIEAIGAQIIETLKRHNQLT